MRPSTMTDASNHLQGSTGSSRIASALNNRLKNTTSQSWVSSGLHAEPRRAGQREMHCKGVQSRQSETYRRLVGSKGMAAHTSAQPPRPMSSLTRIVLATPACPCLTDQQNLNAAGSTSYRNRHDSSAHQTCGPIPHHKSWTNQAGVC